MKRNSKRALPNPVEAEFLIKMQHLHKLVRHLLEVLSCVIAVADFAQTEIAMDTTTNKGSEAKAFQVDLSKSAKHSSSEIRAQQISSLDVPVDVALCGVRGKSFPCINLPPTHTQ
jgi:hypothetical protein